jgi:hypothetical protein
VRKVKCASQPERDRGCGLEESLPGESECRRVKEELEEEEEEEKKKAVLNQPLDLNLVTNRAIVLLPSLIMTLFNSRSPQESPQESAVLVFQPI